MKLAVKPHRCRMMQRARDCSANAPTVQRWIVDLNLALTSETTDHEDAPGHLRDRDLGAFRQHGRARCPPSPVWICNNGVTQEHAE